MESDCAARTGLLVLREREIARLTPLLSACSLGHDILPTSLGGKDWYTNLQLLHDFCHDYKSAKDGSKGRIHDKDGDTEEPNEVKISRPVLKTSRGGDPLA